MAQSETAQQVKATIDYLRLCQRARQAGYPVAYTNDPEWLVDMAIGRRAGWVEDPHARGIVQPVRGKLPRFATGDAQRHLGQIAGRVNSRVIVRGRELGEWHGYLMKQIPERFWTEEA